MPALRFRLRTLLVPLAAVAILSGNALAQTPKPADPMPSPMQAPNPPAPLPLQPGDPFGEEVALPPRTIIYIKGHANWDSAFETLVDAFKSLNEFLAKQEIKPDGRPIAIYTETSDMGFDFQAAVPVAKAPANPPKGDIAVGEAPTGRAFKFMHRGSYEAMDTTYEAVTNYLDDKRLDAKEMFVEEYLTDPVKTDADNLVVNIFVPVK